MHHFEPNIFVCKYVLAGCGPFSPQPARSSDCWREFVRTRFLASYHCIFKPSLTIDWHWVILACPCMSLTIFAVPFFISLPRVCGISYRHRLFHPFECHGIVQQTIPGEWSLISPQIHITLVQCSVV